jgi:hypothetical protein
MLHNQYVTEKLRELQNERRDLLLGMRMAEAAAAERRPKHKPVIGPVLRAAGRTLRRAGEGLEGWGSPEPDGDRRLEREREPAR